MTKRWVPLRDCKMCSQYVLPRTKWKLSLAYIIYIYIYLKILQGAAEYLLLEGKSSIFIIIILFHYYFPFPFRFHYVWTSSFVAGMSSSFTLWICSPCFIFRLFQNHILNSTHSRLALMRDNRNNRNEFIFDSEPPKSINDRFPFIWHVFNFNSHNRHKIDSFD